MRKSLSLASTLTAAALSAVLAGAAVVDQVGAQSLADHAREMYAPYGEQPSDALLYGLLYTTAGLGVVLWGLVARSVQARSRWALAADLVVVATTAALGFTLLLASEYGQQVFPPLWGLLALLPPLAGLVAAGSLLRAGVRSGGARRTTASTSALASSGSRR